MCFSPQRRAIFEHLNFKKWSETVSFLTFWLVNVLLATAACNFSTSQLQKMFRECSVLYIFTWKCASRHSGVQFFNISTLKVVRNWRVLYIFTLKCASYHSGVQFLISPLTTWLRTRRFTEPTFRLTRHEKTQHFATFLPFGVDVDFCVITSSFFWFYFLFWLYFLLTLLHLIYFSSLLFNSPYCRKFTI